MKSLVSGVLVRLGSLSSEDKFEEPGLKCPGSIRKSFDQGYLPKNLVPSVLAHEEPGPTCPGSIRKSFDRGYFPKSVVPVTLVQSESSFPECTKGFKVLSSNK